MFDGEYITKENNAAGAGVSGKHWSAGIPLDDVMADFDTYPNVDASTLSSFQQLYAAQGVTDNFIKVAATWTVHDWTSDPNIVVGGFAAQPHSPRLRGSRVSLSTWSRTPRGLGRRPGCCRGSRSGNRSGYARRVSGHDPFILLPEVPSTP